MRPHFLASKLALAAALAVSTTAIAPLPLAAQSLHYLSAEVLLGSSHGRGGDPLSPYRNTFNRELSLTAGFGVRRAGSALASLNGISDFSMGDDLECPSLGDGCIPYYPRFGSISLLVGWQTPRPERGTLRLLAGPGAFSANYSNVIVPHSLGWTAKVDGATPSLLHVSVIGSFRATVIPSANGTRYRQHMLAFGLRIHELLH